MLLAYPGGSFADSLQQELAEQTFVGGKRVLKQKLPKLPKRAETTVHVVKVNLHGAKPPVWRRLEIPSAMTLDLVHEVLRAAFDWDGYGTTSSRRRSCPPRRASPTPRCTTGRGETPAEDSGGIWTFNEQRAQDAGAGFDPADVTEALADLAGVVAPAS